MKRTVLAASAAIASSLLNHTQIYSQYRRFHDWLFVLKDIIKTAAIGHFVKPG